MFDVQRGTVRRWYMGKEGVMRWYDNDQPVKSTTVQGISEQRTTQSMTHTTKKKPT